ncbi:MAG TPA: hypothetical protein VM890_11170 [Longimicrobium sp.]|jgi:hypothetical protein|nr:hypothetical protein [Longimicrobium sp.]
MLRKLVPFIALALAAAACSADSVTGPSSQQAPTQARHTGGMIGGGG